MTIGKNSLGALALAFVFLAGGSPATAAEYAIDTSHSQVQFSVRHLGISTVTGKFTTFEGSLTFDPEAAEAYVSS